MRAARRGTLRLSVLAAALTTACDRNAGPGVSKADSAAVAQAGVPLVYARCVGCHQLNGKGIPNVYPPLTGDSRVNGPAAVAIAIMLHGMQGEVTVNGATYVSAMMPSGDGLPMSDQDIADVLTYARSSWGNTAPPVTADDVARVRTATAGRTNQWTPAELARFEPLGAQVFARCATCHQPQGQGVRDVFPPLAGSEWVTGRADAPIAIVLHGVHGPITVRGITYDNSMLPYGTTAPLTDDEVAAVLTYVRSHWGNAAPAVSAADVARVRVATAGRTTQYTAAELAALR